MAIVNTHYGFCAKGGAAVKFTYTGEYNVRDDGVVELLTSGTIVFLESTVIDVFMVGGGGSGGYVGDNVGDTGCGGGGGGYTRTVRKVSVLANTSIPVTIGAGGALRQGGGASAFNTIYTVAGGATGVFIGTSATSPGGAGGSGGGGGVESNSDYGAGGSDGSNGERGSFGISTIPGGEGQGFTTREFGEATGKLYAGGGGGGRYMSAQSPVISMGGAGGGGAGAWCSSGNYQPAAAGGANTGGGGGGRATYASSNAPITAEAGTGGSGIVCFREAQELPELAETWVLNARLYKADNTITQSLNFRLSSTSSADFNSILIDNDAVRVRAVGQSGYGVLYTFSTNSWGGSVPPISMTITSETASDEFRAWLASNATKQS